MTTIVIHGTLAKGSSWFWNSWGVRGFCHILAETMTRVSGAQDVWRVKGKPVSEIPELNPKRNWSPWRGIEVPVVTVDGRFEWSGAPEGLARGAAAIWLARYLNVLRQLTDEPIRIVAHSHGCNVVKLSSGLPELSPEVFIAKAVFLACPHFWEPNSVFEEVQGLDKFDLKKLKPKLKGRKYRYRASPKRFGKILNLYSSRDPVQVTLAQDWSGAYAPLTGDALKEFWRMLGTADVYEVPHQVERTDSDPEAQGLYENFEVPVSAQIEGTHVHSAMHGAVAAMVAGCWLNSNTDIPALMAKYGQFPEVPAGDEGA